MSREKLNTVDLMIDFEDGKISRENFFKLFSHLIKTGQAWTLQGFYGRTARRLIDCEFINKDGDINWGLIEIEGKKQWLY